MEHGPGQLRPPRGRRAAEDHDELPVQAVPADEPGGHGLLLLAGQYGQQIGQRVGGEQLPRPLRIALEHGRPDPARHDLPLPVHDLRPDEFAGRAPEQVAPDAERGAGHQLLEPPAPLAGAPGRLGPDAVALHRGVALEGRVDLELPACDGEAAGDPLGHPPPEP
nr:hypothetical protein GCM10020093_037370 [Planobispora longispora]